ncbi:MAG: GH144, partial [uncultured Sphingomonas sp.]
AAQPPRAPRRRACSAGRHLARRLRSIAPRHSGALAAVLLRGHRAPHLSLLLGDGESHQWPGARPLADPVLLQHRCGRLRAHRLPSRSRARLVQPGGSARPDAHHLAFLPSGATGTAAGRGHRAPRLLLPFPRHGDGPPFPPHRAVERRHHHPPHGGAVRRPLLRRAAPGRARDPEPGRGDLRARRLELLQGRRPRRHLHGLAPGNRPDRAQLGRLQRRHVRLPAGPRRARAPGAGGQLEAMDRALSALLARRGAHPSPRLRAVVRPPVQPHLDRFPQHPGCADARRRPRLFREQPPRHLRQPCLLRRQPAALERLLRPHLGPHRVRRSRRLHPAVQGSAATVPRLCRPRSARPAGRARRRHHRPDRRARLPALRTGDRGALRRGDASPAWCAHLRTVRLPRQLQPELPLHRAQDRHRRRRSGARMGGARLSRHRPGSDPAAGGEPPQRVRLARHAGGARGAAGASGRGVHGRLARRL